MYESASDRYKSIASVKNNAPIPKWKTDLIGNRNGNRYRMPAAETPSFELGELLVFTKPESMVEQYTVVDLFCGVGEARKARIH